MHTEKKKGFARFPLLLGGGLALGLAFLLALTALPSVVSADGVESPAEQEGLSLIMDTPEEGMQVALHFQTVAEANDYWR